MQMRFASVSGIPNARQHLPSPDTIPCLHSQTSRLQMHVVCKLAAAEVERDCIGGDCLQRYWHCWVERVAVSGDVIGKTISCRNDAAIGNRQH